MRTKRVLGLAGLVLASGVLCGCWRDGNCLCGGGKSSQPPAGQAAAQSQTWNQQPKNQQARPGAGPVDPNVKQAGAADPANGLKPLSIPDGAGAAGPQRAGNGTPTPDDPRPAIPPGTPRITTPQMPADPIVPPPAPAVPPGGSPPPPGMGSSPPPSPPGPTSQAPAGALPVTTAKYPAPPQAGPAIPAAPLPGTGVAVLPPHAGNGVE